MLLDYRAFRLITGLDYRAFRLITGLDYRLRLQAYITGWVLRHGKDTGRAVSRGRHGATAAKR